MIFLLMPAKVLQHAQYSCIYTSKIRLLNSVKGQCLVDLVQLYSPTSLSRTSTPLLIVIIIHNNFKFVVLLLAHAHVLMLS